MDAYIVANRDYLLLRVGEQIPLVIEFVVARNNERLLEVLRNPVPEFELEVARIIKIDRVACNNQDITNRNHRIPHQEVPVLGKFQMYIGGVLNFHGILITKCGGHQLPFITGDSIVPGYHVPARSGLFHLSDYRFGLFD